MVSDGLFSCLKSYCFTSLIPLNLGLILNTDKAMFSFPRIIKLSESTRTEPLRVCSAPATLPQSGKKTSWVTITRVGSFTDPRYGRCEITAPMLLSMVHSCWM